MGTPFTVVAAILTAIVAFFAGRVQSSAERRERQNDILVGIHAEIVAGGHLSALVAERRGSAFDYEQPFATSDRTDFVFESIKGDISILPEQVIHSVVRYYRLAEQTNRMTDDLRDETFAALPTPAKRWFVTKLLIAAGAQSAAADFALDAIQDYADEHLSSGTALILRQSRALRFLTAEGLGRTVEWGRTDGSDQP